MATDVLLFALPFALFAGAVVLGFQDLNRAGGVLMVSAGLLSMRRSHEMAATQNQLNKTRWRYLLGGGTYVVRPQLYLLWGVGVSAVGVAWLVLG